MDLVYNQRIMLGQRRNTDFDQFINQNQQVNRMVSPRNAPLNNLTNGYYSNGYQDIKNIEKMPERHVYRLPQDRSPNKINNTRKPMISPVRPSRQPTGHVNQPNRFKPKQDTDRNWEYFCSNENHRNKRAEYIIHIEDEDMHYCGVCATQAASQGFTVNRINAPKKQKSLPYYPNYSNNKRYNELMEFMKDIMQLESEYKRKGVKQVQENYIHQELLLNSFYDELSGLVERMREDHLADLKAEEAKNKQTVELMHDGLKIHMDDLNEIWEDIEETFQQVVQVVDASSYEGCMKTYRNLTQVFHHKLEQFDEVMSEFTTYDESDLEMKVRVFEKKLIDLWQDDFTEQPTQKRAPVDRNKASTLPYSRQPQTIKAVHEMLPRTQIQQNCQGQTAFRNIFPDDEQSESRMPEASPQFKAF